MNQEKTGKFIAKLRKDKNMTQEQLAEKMGVSINAVSKWERGLSFPDVLLYKKLCEELGISIEELINGEYDNSDSAKERAIIKTLNEKKILKNKAIKIIFSIIIIFIISIVCLAFYNKKLRINLINDSDELYDVAITYLKDEEFKNNKDSKEKDFNVFYSYHSFGIEEKNNYKYAYMWLYMQSYYIEGKDALVISSGNSIPCKIVFKDNKVVKTECPEIEYPKKEEKYVSSIKRIFPSIIADQVLDFDKEQNIGKLYNEVVSKKNKYYDYLSLDMGSLELEDISYGDFIFLIRAGDMQCTPIQLNIYKNNKYVLYNKYEACKPGVICLSYLKYVGFIEGTYNYDISQIIKHSTDANNMQFSNNNLPKYEIVSGKGYPFITDDDNKYLIEFLKSININLEQCATANYSD